MDRYISRAVAGPTHDNKAKEDDEGHVTAQKGTEIFRDNGGRFLVVSKELCYGKAERLEDAEKAARGWRHNLVR
jgi:hypothetical protein